MFLSQFGGRATRAWTKQYERSAHWQKGQFQNLEPTKLSGNLLDIPRIIYKQLSQREGRSPLQPLPVAPFEMADFVAPDEHAKFIWYGHSAILLRVTGKTLLIDPMLGPDTTPIAPIPTQRFSENTLSLINDFPEIDLMLITHDHYDHLDYASIQQLKSKTKRYLVALGVKRHLVRWGVEANLITEMDWWESFQFDTTQITFTPTRHFSGRGLTDRQKTLWGGWFFDTPKEKIWFSGDGGYGQHFREIGRRLGPIDLAFMECGQYNHDWHDIHLFPEEAVQAALDAGVKKAMPVHWGGFALSYQHTWQEPPNAFVQAANSQQVDYLVPPLGQLFRTNSTFQSPWWNTFS